uniref:Retrovirus-related Pol polyprotein from transposon TNT 1-94 n=1 Tax=Tanacetum cinerariifolium TaxID=118510 RepID=A0A6L2LVD2_TANCI|nr:retrovirus-related Pol polyprotein from transposon TNT 1-94 [Tanacetum cinerariifolium]
MKMSVLKQWKSLIDNPKFITSYHSCKTHLFVKYEIANDLKYVSIANDDTFPNQISSITVPQPISLLDYTSTLTSFNEYVFALSGGVVDWKSAKQITTVMSSTEAGYIDAAEASMKAVWMRKFIDGLGNVMPSNKRLMEMLCDNEHEIAIANGTGILKGSKHF